MNCSSKLFACLAALLLAVGCGGSPQPDPTPVVSPETSGEEAVALEQPEHIRQPPPESAAPRDVHLPPTVRTSLRNGLEVNTSSDARLPLVYARLVVRSGLARDPANLPGLSRFVGEMLQQGTRTRDSARLADEIEYLGASLDVSTDADSMALQIRGTSDQLDAMLALLADVAMNPAFANADVERERQQQIDRLAIAASDPSRLAYREFYRLAYGAHPYGHVDLSAESVRAIRRADLVAWHRRHFVPSNAFLVVVGDVTAEASARAVERAFGAWRGAAVPALTLPEPPRRTEREILVVHRPGSVQSVIAIGNLAIARADRDYVSLAVANQVLGGSPASRLFLDLRERRSLTYGAYSNVDELVGVSPFRARAAVPNARTEPAMDAFMEHLERIVREPAPVAEIRDAERYLSDSFPLQIDTYGRIAWMVGYLRLFGLPDDYWDGYRTQIRSVSPEEALRAAQAHIHPDRAIVVVVGDADVVAEPLRRWGTVSIVDTNGAPLPASPAAPAAEQ